VADVLTRSLADTDAEVHSAVAAALATRGFGDDFREVADIIAPALKPDFDDDVAASLRQRASILAAKHPRYPEPGASNGAQE
jgi:glycine hydroxymethyltransferase